MRRQLRSDAERVIGISWRSFQPKTRRLLERKKSAPLEAFRALSQRRGTKLLDLQYGDTARDLEAFRKAGGKLARIEGLDLFNDLEGVLAAIEACDLIITTSNVTAHLAGALGKETWLLYLADNAPFFYWVPDAQGRSLWYPSVRIVTDRAWNRWEELFSALERRLDERLSSNA